MNCTRCRLYSTNMVYIYISIAATLTNRVELFHTRQGSHWYRKYCLAVSHWMRWIHFCIMSIRIRRYRRHCCTPASHIRILDCKQIGDKPACVNTITVNSSVWHLCNERVVIHMAIISNTNHTLKVKWTNSSGWWEFHIVFRTYLMSFDYCYLYHLFD